MTDKQNKKGIAKRYFGYHVTFNRIKNENGVVVASISGHQIISNDKLFEDSILEGSSLGDEYSSSQKKGDILYSLISSITKEPIAKVDKYYNIYSLENKYLGSIYNSHSETKFTILFLLFLLICISLGFIAFYRTGDPFNPQDIVITEVDGNPVTDSWNIFPYKIYPGKMGKYYFDITNNDTISSDIFVSFSEQGFSDIPMQYRLRSSSSYICGDEDNWVTIDELKINGIRITGKETVKFVLEWRWYDDGTRDEKDTQIGSKDSSDYVITIEVVAQPQSKSNN